MSTRLLSRRDIDFLIYEWLDVCQLLDRQRFEDHSRETFDAVLNLSEQIASRHFAGHNRLSDLNEPTFRNGGVAMIPEVGQALSVFAEAGLFAGDLDYEFGGMQLPKVVAGASMAWFEAANVATTAYAFLTIAAAHLLLRFGDEDLKRSFVTPMAEGRWFGTMCLSEPEAGSSLADVTTRALPDGPGRYRVFGTKMWISGGDHDLAENIVHLVLARISGSAPGVKGLSLFVVPKVMYADDPTRRERNDVVLAGLNHKMGFRGTANTVLSFGEGGFTPQGAPGAIGYLIGEAGSGLKHMFHMMNEARIGVGRMAAALGYTGYLKSLDYARERRQGRARTQPDPLSPQLPIIEHADVRRMLLAQKAYAEGALALNLYCARLLDDQQTEAHAEAREEAGLLLEILTPIAKSWPSQWCLIANELAIQVLGGAGYSQDHDVELHYRDNRLNQIHEGTQGIQAIDLLGRKVAMRDGAGISMLLARIRRTVAVAGARGGEALTLAELLESATHAFESVTTILRQSEDRDIVMANASTYLEVAGHVVVAWIWLEQLLATRDETDDFYEGKRHAARFFFRHELPKVRPLLDLLGTLDRTTLDCSPAWF